ncbi:carbohydrate ABC transporter, N-acetylglucosamine/diacetylchitobiose-binding protein [Kitasatospora herbaricolor]|uniref:N-acetylglucosamine/diacetylchitobiose ABC transporter substrate-binding protein n=1 Tax=Kitasatospora herbaricolor TaxID=68217 RepID=UPI00174DBA9E|nr:N-acetylglucosamine/diacetylchitobiose ABC transporter substrate-binding protein [Kitasatospora herbaricolor]MDQ0305804.1 N-acetylglucosamine transport system substrate-binding protein [Kitasatospora herbaricolor]GGV26717.1 carbohydrate ABC transporter, N-acetylglucosamine/diacetylchitobiose-binding protein [Kitasatospora herbaricolor]
MHTPTHSPAPMTRRQLLIRSATAAAIAVPGAGLLTACAGGTGTGSPSAQGTQTADNPFGVVASAPLDVYVFKGGLGEGFAKAFEDLYGQRFPGAKISHSSGTDVTGDLQPRFNAGSPPDFVFDDGDKKMKLDVLHANGQLANLDVLLDAPSLDDPSKKVRDVLVPGTVEAGQIGTSMFSLNYALTVYGIWYSKSLFAKKGWKVPKTWDEFTALCETIKAAGMSPWAHQGKYPFYMLVVLMDMIAKAGGEAVMKKIDNLQPGAWQEDAVLRSVERIHSLVAGGYTLAGTEGLTHTEAQTAWAQGKAAFIPCGSWLEQEMSGSIPADFDMAVMPVPHVPSDRMPATAVRAVAAEAFIVPTRAANQAGGLELLRIMCSKAGAAAFAKEAKSLPVVRGALTPEITAAMSPGTKSSSDLIAAAADDVITWKHPTWYSQLETDLETAMGELMGNRIGPAEFVKRAQSAADRTAATSSIQKYTRA